MNLMITSTPKYTQIRQNNISQNAKKLEQNSNNNSTKKTISNYTNPISFTSKAKTNSGLENAWEDFTQKAKDVYGNIPISEVVDLAMTDENIIGEGSAKAVYKIPNIDDYVIGREKRKTYHKQDFVRMDIPFERYNFGQPIAETDSGIIIMKKVNGKSHSLDNWSDKVDKLLFGQPVERSDAKEFLEAMKTVSKMPLNSYIDLANQIKYLSDGGHRLDILSPNNVLIDPKNQQMNLIDLIDGQDRFENFEGELNTVYDLQNILCGTILHEASRKQLSPAEAKELDKATIETLKKCEMAGKYAGLTTDKTNTINFYNVMDGFVSHFLGCEPKFLETYLQFADRYKDYINPNE